MDRGSWHCIEGSDQGHAQEKEMQIGKMVVWGGLTNSCEKRSQRQREKEKYTHLNAEFQEWQGEIQKASLVFSTKK